MIHLYIKHCLMMIFHHLTPVNKHFEIHEPNSLFLISEIIEVGTNSQKITCAR